MLRENTGVVETLYLHGLDIIGQQQGGAWTGFGYDPLGSVRFVLDNSGALTHALNYDPYGVPLQANTTNTTLGFTGEQTDPNDLVYLRARYYHPMLGAFTSADPVLGVGGSTGWNGYLYANGNPANLTDPAGTCTEAAQNAGFFQCIGYDIFNTLAQVFYALPDVYSNAPRYFADGLKDTWKDGLSGWWSGIQESLPHVWAFTFEVALPMFWEPADWISGIVNGDPLALLPLVPSAARFASHASSPLSIGRRAANHLNQSIPAGALCSFDADTTVATSDGSIRIDQIKVDDKVLAYDEGSGEVGEYSVTAVLKHDDPIIIHLTVDGETIDTTPEHPFYVEGSGWVAAGELQVGDHLRKADGGYGVVQSLHTEPRSETMYNLTVEEAHTFFVGEGQWLVHNICDPNNKLLLVGEGDFSFSRSLVENGKIDPKNLVATSFDSLEVLREKYVSIDDTLEFLRSNGATILHDVDARRLHTINLGQFDVIAWNFPHDGRSILHSSARHHSLFKEFFASAQSRLNDGGVIRVTLPDQPPYYSWNAPEAGIQAGMNYLGSSPFVFGDYPGYHHRLTNRDQSKVISRAITHIFGR